MTDNNQNKYAMSINLNVLNHLGINLYSNIPAVLSEIVANSWDADAENVSITIERDKITIIDDGLGMSEEDINEKFLTVGYQKRESGVVVSKKHKRPVMGRKGIGKLSMFSISETIDIVTKKSGKISSFQLDINDIKKSIEKGEPAYYPRELSIQDEELEKDGTKIILRSLKKGISSLTSDYIRKRVARRFSIIGQEHSFKVTVNEREVSIADRDYFSKLDYIWYYGDESKKYADIIPTTPNEERGNKIYSENNLDFKLVSGWIGTVKKSGDLKDENENINKIVILVRGKLGQENILDEFSEGGLYSKYLIGEIHADFFDDDKEEDIATSNRQEYNKDNERFIALKKFIQNELKYIQRKWTDLRNDTGLSEVKTLMPAIKPWLSELNDDDLAYAKKLFGKINQIPVEDMQRKVEIFRFGIIAFEKLKHRRQLNQIDEIDMDNIEPFLPLLKKIDEIEEVLYHQIIKERIEIIKKFRGIIDDNVKEKTIQEYLFDHLWLLDPSWERAESTEFMESKVLTALNYEFNQLTPDEKNGRLDIGYRTTAGKHIVIELKKADRIVPTHELVKQIEKYSNAMRKVLRDVGKDESFEIICILGKPVNNDQSSEGRNRVAQTLEPYNARVVHYDELIENSYNAYKDYLLANEKVEPLYEIFKNLDDEIN